MLQNVPGLTIADLLACFAEQKAPDNFFAMLHSYILEESSALPNRLALLEKLLNKTPKDISNTLFKPFIANPFPIIFVYEKEKKLSLFGAYKMEYRVTAPLKLGEDILMIATDTVEHQKMIRNYLTDNKLSGITVISFDKLYRLEQQEEIHSVFKRVGQEDSNLMRAMKAYKLDIKDFKKKLNAYEGALVAELDFLPSQDAAPLQAARALAALNEASNHIEFFNKLKLFTQAANCKKFYPATQRASSEPNLILANLIATALVSDFSTLILIFVFLLAVKRVWDLGFSQQSQIASRSDSINLRKATSQFFRPHQTNSRELIEVNDEKSEISNCPKNTRK